MADIKEEYTLQSFTRIPSRRNIKTSILKNICNFISKIFCCCRKRSKLSPEAQKYLETRVGVGPVPPHLLDELKKYKEENKLDIILTIDEAQKSFNQFNEKRNNEVNSTFKSIQLEHYIDKKTGKLSETLSEETRDFLNKDNGLGVIPQKILDELTQFRIKIESR